MRHYKNINLNKDIFIGNINEFQDYNNEINNIEIIPDDD